VLLASLGRQIESEHARAESLLLNVLPKAIARRLKSAPGIIADSYEDATILFADVVSSTPLTSSLSARDMVALLDEYVTHFDGLARRHGVEKIRTIGDNWMGVAGVPTGHADHAIETNQPVVIRDLPSGLASKKWPNSDSWEGRDRSSGRPLALLCSIDLALWRAA